jgi:hypothetical protein
MADFDDHDTPHKAVVLDDKSMRHRQRHPR